MTDLFPINMKNHKMETRQPNLHKVEKFYTERLKNRVLFQCKIHSIRKIINRSSIHQQNEKEKKETKNYML